MKTIFISLILIILTGNTLFPMGKTAEIEHRITYSRQGTRSEAKHGHLFINGNEVPALFTIIISGKEVFSFHQRTWLWGIDGYFPVEETKNTYTIKESSAQIGSDLLDKGWYAGKERLSGTPANWLYVEWNAGSAFISPEKIKNIAAELNLTVIPRWETPAIMQKNKRP